MIIAIDFDGVLCESKFPKIGKPNKRIINLTKKIIDRGHEVILWTSRADKSLKEAVKWCKAQGLKFTTVNENAPSNIKLYKHICPNGTRKVYADCYIDDHNSEFIGCPSILVKRRIIYDLKRILEKEK